MNEITKSEHAKLHFCTEYWDTNGGAIDKRPYYDTTGSEYTGKRQRVYLNTLWYRDWAAFSPAADRALTAASVQYDAYHDRYVKIGTSYPFDEKPHYLLEPSPWPNTGDYSIWVNCLCPDEASFNATLAEAREKVASMKKRDPSSSDFRVASLFEKKPDTLLYPSEWNQDKDGTVGALLRRKGIK